MATLRVVTYTLFALSAAVQVTAEPQSRFAQPRSESGGMRFRAMDRNNDGVVTRQEWRGSDESFRVHDWNSDGVLSGDEVRESFWTTGEESKSNPAASERDERFEYLDANNNGTIERSEWHASDDAWAWLDRNNDGVLTRREVVGNQRQAVPRGAPNTAATTTSGQDCTSSAPQVVDDIYQQVLERPADQASAEFTRALAAGQMTVRDIVARVAKSPEHAERFFWAPVVSAVYQQILRREPSQQELREGAADLAAGQRRLPEFVARTAARATNNQEDAIRILYQRLLGREADPTGLQGFKDLAQREGIEAVARSIVNSAEYRRRAGADRMTTEDETAYQNAVRSLYRHVLGRDPDDTGLRDLTRAATTSGFDAVVDRMVGSTEYQRLFGDNTVPGRNVRYCGTTR